MEFQGYSAMPQTITASPIRTAAVEGMPIIRIEKESGSNERKCTDVRSLVAFISFLSLSVYIAALAISNGSIGRLTHGVNHNGGICGSGSSLGGYPYLYYPLDPTSSTARLLPNARKCLRSCPSDTDVQAHRVVPITRTQIERNSRGTSSSVLEYTVNTPVYATVAISGRLCLPVDPSLSYQLMQEILRQPVHSYRALVGSVLNGWSVIIGVTVFSFLLGLVHTWMFKTIPRLLIFVAGLVGVWAGVVLGISLLASAAHSVVEVVTAGDDPNIWIPRIPLELTGSFLIGTFILIGSVGLAVVLFYYRELISVACRVNESIADVLWTRPNGGLLGSPSVTSIVTGSLGIFWIIIFVLLSGSSRNAGVPQLLSGNRNGSSIVLSLERQDGFPLWALSGILIWTFTGFWVSEFLFSLLKFSVCYTATMWYFVEEPDAFETPNPARLTPSIVSLSIGLLNHSGSFATAGLWFGLTRPFRMLKAWTKSRYFRYNTPTREERVGLERVTDLLTSNAFVEMAVASTSLNTSLKAARNRGLQRPSASATLLGAAGLGSSISVVAVVLVSGLMTFSILSKSSDYAAPTSQSYVQSPLFATLVAMIFSAMVVAPHIDCWAVLADALLYCYLLESESAGGLDEDPTSKTHAPLPLRDLICEEKQLWSEPILCD